MSNVDTLLEKPALGEDKSIPQLVVGVIALSVIGAFYEIIDVKKHIINQAKGLGRLVTTVGKMLRGKYR